MKPHHPTLVIVGWVSIETIPATFINYCRLQRDLHEEASHRRGHGRWPVYWNERVFAGEEACRRAGTRRVCRRVELDGRDLDPAQGRLCRDRPGQPAARREE